MNLKAFAIVLLVSALILFGCCGGTQQGGQTPTPGPTATQGGQTPTPGPTATPGGGGGNGLSGLGWGALIALGTPVQCTVRSGDQTWDMKIRGSNTRAEGDATSEGQTTHILMIQKNDVTYMQMSDEMRQMPGASDCVWLRMEQNTTGSTTGGAENTDFNTLPPENMTCSPAFFGDDIFATPGRACSMDDLIGGLGATPTPGGIGENPTPGGTPGGEDACSYCAEITDPEAKAICLQYCG